MRKLPREMGRCSFQNVVRRKECAHYRPGRRPAECHDYQTEITETRGANGSVTRIYHCRYDPPKLPQERLL